MQRSAYADADDNQHAGTDTDHHADGNQHTDATDLHADAWALTRRRRADAGYLQRGDRHVVLRGGC